MAVNQQKVDLKSLKEELMEIAKACSVYTTKLEKANADKRAIRFVERVKASFEPLKVTTRRKYYSALRAVWLDTPYVIWNFKEKCIDEGVKKFPSERDFFESMDGKTISEINEIIRNKCEEIAESNDKKKRPLLDFLTLPLNNPTRSPEPLRLRELKVDLFDSKAVKKDTAEKVTAKQSKLIDVELNTIEAIKSDFLAPSDFDANKPYKLALALALCLGRRSIEIIARGKFEKSDREGFVSFSGAVKSNNPDYKIDIPCYFDIDRVLSGIEELRATSVVSDLIAEMSKLSYRDANEFFNNNTRKFNDFARHIFTTAFNPKPNIQIEREGKMISIPCNWMFKDSRAIYAKYGFYMYERDCYRTKSPVSTDSIFYTRVLGHADKGSQEHYKVFRVVNSDIAFDVEVFEKNNSIESLAIDNAERIEKLKKCIQEKEYITESNGHIIAKLMDRLLEWITDKPSTVINSKFLRGEFKGAKTIHLNAFYSYLKAYGIAQ